MWLITKNIKRGRWWLPPSPGRGESCESMYAHGLSLHQKCSNHVLTNLLFGLDPLVIPPNPHPKAPAHPLLSKCYKLRNMPQLLLLSMFSLSDLHLNLSTSVGCMKNKKILHNLDPYVLH